MTDPYYSGPDRRVLDPAMRAEVHHVSGIYGVKTGDGPFVLHTNFADAHRQALVHNHMHGHELIVDRRKS